MRRQDKHTFVQIHTQKHIHMHKQIRMHVQKKAVLPDPSMTQMSPKWHSAPDGPPVTANDHLTTTRSIGGLGAAGASHNSPRTPSVHISGPRRFKHHHNSTRRHPERHRKSKTVGRKRKRKRALRGPTPAGPPPGSLVWPKSAN